MRFGIFAFFILLFAEIWSIIEMGDQIGALATIVLLVAGFFFGLQLMRSQGIRALMQGVKSRKAGGSPLAIIAEAVVKAFAGILLIIPGFVSDVIALIILLPFVRTGFAGYLAKKGQFKGFADGGFGSGGFGMFGRGAGGPNDLGGQGGNVYEHKGPAKPTGKPTENRILEHDPDSKD